MATRKRKTGSGNNEEVRTVSEAEAYVKQFCPRAEVRKIEPRKDTRFVLYNDPKAKVNLSTRYFIGTFNGHLSVAVHSGSMQTPEAAWKDAQKSILRYVLRKFEE